MSTYTVDITLGPYSFTIDSTDTYDPAADVYVLDVLRIGWNTNEGSPAPAAPNPVTASLQLLTRDVANLEGIEALTPAFITISSAGALIASCAGRLAEPVVSSVRRDGVQWAVYNLAVVDYTADPNEIPVTLSRAQEDGDDRIAAIAAAAGLTINTAGTDLNLDLFEALEVVGSTAGTVLADHLWQASDRNLVARRILLPQTTAGSLDSYTVDAISSPQVANTWPPAEFAIIDNELTLVFVDPKVDALPTGLVVSSSEVDDQVTFRQSKGRKINKVTLTNSVDTYTLDLNRPNGEPVVALDLQSTQLAPQGALAVVRLFLLGAGTRNQWRVESFDWEPSDAELAALQWPLTPDTETGDHTCYQAQVVVDGIAPTINPSSPMSFYAGTLDGASVTLAGGRVRVGLVINHRLPIPVHQLGPDVGVTWAQLRTQIGTTVKYRTGTNVVDPDLTWYETRLAREA